MGPNSLRKALARGVAGAAVCAFLTACGQKGPLYLPAPTQAASTPSPSLSK
nr:lipoprotein [Aquabacterium sp. NJ1]